jgi:hypothetical protein
MRTAADVHQAADMFAARQLAPAAPPPSVSGAADARSGDSSLVPARHAAAAGCSRWQCVSGAAAGFRSWLRQLRVLTWREFLVATRNPVDVAGRMLLFAWARIGRDVLGSTYAVEHASTIIAIGFCIC